MKHQSTTTELAPLDSNPATNIRDSREEIFLHYLFNGFSVQDSGKAAGYSNQYSISAIYKKFNSQRFQDKIRQYALAHNSISIPRVCNLYDKTLKVLDKEVEQGNLENMGKLKHVTTHILQIGKILSPEVHQSVINLVNIENMQTLIQGKLPPTGSDTEWATSV